MSDVYVKALPQREFRSDELAHRTVRPQPRNGHRREDETWRTPLRTLRTQFLDGAGRYPELRLMVVTAHNRSQDMLDGPPTEMWRGHDPVIFSVDVAIDSWNYRSCLWGDVEGVELVRQLQKSTDRCLRAIPPPAGRKLFEGFDVRLGCFGLVEHLARYKLAGPLLRAERATWDGTQQFRLRSDNQIFHRIDLYPADPDYYYSLLEPNVFSACAYSVDYLLDDGGATFVIVRSSSAGTSTQSKKRGKLSGRQRGSRARSSLTDRQKQAWSIYQRTRCYEEVGRQMNISRQAAAKHVQAANAKLQVMESRSVRTTGFPTDPRGQIAVSDDE